MIKDWRIYQHPMLNRKERRIALLVPNWEGTLIRYYWECPAPHLGNRPESWSRMCQQMYHHVHTLNPQLAINIDTMYLVEDCQPGEARLLIHPWADSWKWGRARTLYHPSVAWMVQKALASGIIGEDDPVAFGNWASGVNYEQLGRAGDVAQLRSLNTTLRLYHGTSSVRLPLIMEQGFKLDRTKGVHVSGSSMRAEYFSTDKTRKDRKTLPTKKQKEAAHPVVLELEIPIELHDNLEADMDWVKCLKHETGAAPDKHDWRRSLSEFGQVKIAAAIPAAFIKKVHTK